jgi:hypothetical protein
MTMILIAIGACGFMVMRFLLVWENRRRSRITQTWTAEDFERENLNEQRRGDAKLSFKYGY